MNVRIKFKLKNNKVYDVNQRFTVKTAKKYYVENLKDNENVIYAYSEHLGTWRNYLHTIFKDVRKKYKVCMSCGKNKIEDVYKVCADCNRLYYIVKNNLKSVKKIIELIGG